MSARLAAPLLLLLACPAPAHAILVDRISAVVNNEVILNSDIERFGRTVGLRRELDPLFGFSEGIQTDRPDRKKVIEFLVQERLIGQSFRISDGEVEQEVATVQRNNNLNRTQLVDFLKTKGFHYSEYFELMRTGLSKRNLLDREIRSRVNVSDDDVRNYFFNMAMKTSSVPLEYSLQILVVSPRSYKTPRAAQEAADNALRAIRQGEPFAEVARRVSDDASAPNGGELGYLPSEQLAEPLRSTVRKLQIGGTSEVVKSPNGHMIVRLLDARSTETQKLNEMKEEIREQLAKEEYKKQLFIWAERARNNAYVHVN